MRPITASAKPPAPSLPTRPEQATWRRFAVRSEPARLVSAAAFLLSNAGADIIIRRFAPKNAALRALLAAHYPAYAFSLLFLGLNLFLAYVLSATERGHCAAGLSLVRTFVLPTAALFALPLLFEADGLWLAVPAAECLTLLLAALLLGLPARSSRASRATGG